MNKTVAEFLGGVAGIVFFIVIAMGLWQAVSGVGVPITATEWVLTIAVAFAIMLGLRANGLWR